MTVQQGVWAVRRLAFDVYMAFCLLTVVGGWVTAPLFSWCFFGDWRFWRHARTELGMWLHGYGFIGRLIRWENAGFMFSVPLVAQPFRAPNRAVVQLNPSWEHGSSCGSCSRCCDKISCPVLDKATGLCTGYDSFFWRYYNCGRFPSEQREINFYDCPKWVMRPQPIGDRVAVSGRPAGVDSGEDVLQMD